MIARIRTFAVAIAFVPLAACGSDKVTAPNLTTAQVADMMDALSAIGTFGFMPMGASGSRGPAVLASVPITINETDPCPISGTSRLQGTVDLNSTQTALNYSADLTQTFQSCAAQSEAGIIWTFNGRPNTRLQVSGSHNVSTGAFTMSGTQKGTFTFSSAAGTGTCSIDVSFSLSGNFETETGTLSGTVCGQSVNQTL